MKCIPTGSHEVVGAAQAPAFERGGELWRDLGDIVILARDDEYLVTHVMNARWFRTDVAGATILAAYVEHCRSNTEDFACSFRNATFLRRVSTSKFFLPPTQIQPDIPNVVCLSITERCNLECDYCFYSASFRHKGARHHQDLPADELHKLLSELKTINPRVRVYITGGEPFASARVMESLRLVKAHELFVGIVTNATLIRPEQIAEMETIGVDDVRISIDGATAEQHEATRPGTWEKVMSTLKLLAASAVPVTLSPTLTSRNTGALDGLAKLAREFGFSLSYSPGVPTGRAAAHTELATSYEAMIREVEEVEDTWSLGLLSMEHAQGRRQFTCGIAGQSLYVNLEGLVAPCNMLQKTGHDLGNAFGEGGIGAVLKGNRATAVRVLVDDIEHCSQCHIRYVCGGPCRAASLFSTGSLAKRGPHCRLKYAEVVTAMWRRAPLIAAGTRTC